MSEKEAKKRELLNRAENTLTELMDVVEKDSKKILTMDTINGVRKLRTYLVGGHYTPFLGIKDRTGQ